MRDSIVLYEPDKGAAFGHAIRPSRPGPAWKAIQTFLDDCTDVRSQSGIRLVAYNATDWDDAAAVAPIVQSVIDRFGPPALTADGGMNITTGQPRAGGYHEWRGEAHAWPEFVQFVVDGHPWVKTVSGPVSAQAQFRFRWKTAIDPSPVWTSAGTSECELSVSIERSSFAAPRFWFPHPPGSAALADLVRRVARSVPMRLAPRHFRVATVKKDGATLLLRKFDAASLLAV